MKLIAIDMDGTLFSSDRTISEANIQAIKDAKDQGHIVMLCSGRPHDNLLQFLEEQGLVLPLAGSNGAIVYADDRVIHSAAMETKDAAEVYHHLEEQEHPFKIYTNQGIYSRDTFLERAEKEFSNAPIKSGSHRTHIKHFAEFEKLQPSIHITEFKDLEAIDDLEIYKYFIFTPHDSRKETLLSSIEAVNGLSITSSGADNTEIMGIDGHKGNGVIQMAKHYNIPMEDTVAIGDNFNDVAMLKVAGLSVAMGNAEEDVKKLCDVTTLTNDEDGVAYAIRKYVLNEAI